MLSYLYYNFLMDVDASSGDEILDSSENSEEMSDVSDEDVDNQDDDPDYVPLLVHMEDHPYEDSPSSQVILSSGASVENNSMPSEHNDEQNAGDHGAENVLSSKPAEKEKLGEKSIVSSQRNSDDDAQTCTICFEPWTNSNEHRLVSLRCGHLFGRSCITRWLKGQNTRCPQCNARTRKSEIRNIYARCIKVVDSSELDKAIADFRKENELRKTAELVAAKERVKNVLVLQDCERLKKELFEAQKQLQEFRSGAKAITSSNSTNSISSPFHLQQSIPIAKDGGCRIVDFSDVLGMLLVSQPSSNPLFSGYGFRKVSTADMRPVDFVFVHQKPIKDMCFHDSDGLVLTASLDKTVRITNILTNSVVQTYNVEADVWSCTWDAENSNYFYGGLKTGEVYMFDIRVTNRHLHELPIVGSRTPVVSLQYFHNSGSASYAKKCGPIVGKLSDCALHQKTESYGNYEVIPLPPLGPITCLSSDVTGHVLVSCRPSSKSPRVTHTIFNFASESGELICNPINQVTGGSTQVQLSRSKLLNHPETNSSLLICAGDEDAHGALIWDGSSGKSIDNLRTDLPVLDLVDFKVHHSSYLTALTDKSLHLYSWNHHKS